MTGSLPMLRKFAKPRRTIFILVRSMLLTAMVWKATARLEFFYWEDSSAAPKYSQRCNAIGTLPFFQTKSERAEIEFFSLLHARFGQKFRDLQFTDLIRDGLTRARGESDRFLACGLFVHRDLFLKVFRSLVERELADLKLHVHLYTQRVQSHEIVDYLACVWAVIEQPGLQHHLLRIKPDPLIRAGVVVMPPDGILMSPRKTKLKIMTRNSFMNGDRPRIHCRRAPEVTEFF